MAKLTPREVYLGASAGGTSIGLILSALGVVLLNASFGDIAPAWQDAITGATFFAVGAAFVLVSLIVLPALRAIRLESGAAPK
jgi:hypothetical protein